MGLPLRDVFAFGLACGLVVAWASELRAEPGSISAALSYSPPAECVAKARLEQMVERELGRKVFVLPTDADMKAELSIENDGARDLWSATLTVRSASGAWLGARQLVSDSPKCSALNESLALVVALAIDIPREELEKAVEAKVEQSPVRPEPRKIQLLPPVAEAPERSWVVAPSAGFVVGAGLLPNIGFGTRASVSLSPPKFWTMELGGTLWFPSEEDENSRGGRFRLMSADIAVCPFEHERGAFSARGCVAQSLGRIDAQGFGFSENSERDRFFFTTGARARAAIRLTRPFALLFGLDVGVPLTRDRFFYVDRSGSSIDVFRAAPIVGVGEVGLRLDFR